MYETFKIIFDLTSSELYSKFRYYVSISYLLLSSHEYRNYAIKI